MENPETRNAIFNDLKLGDLLSCKRVDIKNTSIDEVNSLVQFEDVNISENLKKSPMLRTLFQSAVLHLCDV